MQSDTLVLLQHFLVPLSQLLPPPYPGLRNIFLLFGLFLIGSVLLSQNGTYRFNIQRIYRVRTKRVRHSLPLPHSLFLLTHQESDYFSTTLIINLLQRYSFNRYRKILLSAYICWKKHSISYRLLYDNAGGLDV